MKKTLILVAVAAVALSACSKNEFIPTVEESTRAISFGSYGPRSITKADTANYVDGTALVPGADFDVWGWYTANGVSFTGSNGTQFFGNSAPWYTVTYQDGGGATTTGAANLYPDGARYWPIGETPDYLHFYAYYPSNAGTITPPDGLGAFSFTAEATAAAQVDFMIADIVKDQTYNTANGNPGTNSHIDGTVDLTFRHMLTKVQVKFKTTQAICDDTLTTIKVDSAYFYHINNTGTLTSSYVAANDSTSTVWSSVSGDAKYDVAVPADTLTKVAANSGVIANDIFLMVPQVMVAPTRNSAEPHDVTADATAQYIHVYWTVTTDGVETHNNRKVYLDECVSTDGGSTQADIDWEKNNFVTYIITIAPNQILFTGAAAAWDSESIGYYNIN